MVLDCINNGGCVLSYEDPALFEGSWSWFAVLVTVHKISLIDDFKCCLAFLSRSAPVKRGLNLGGPPSKAKYS